MLVAARTDFPLGIFVRLRRTHLGLAQGDLAKAAGKSQSYISQIEVGLNPNTGKPPSPTLDVIEALAGALKVPDTLLVDVAFGRLGTSEAELEKVATRDHKSKLAAALAIPGVVTGDRMHEIEHAYRIPWLDEDEQPYVLKKRPTLPLVGEVGCGQPKLEDATRGRPIEVPSHLAGPNRYLVIARGDSLNALGPPLEPVRDGDLLVVRRLREYKSKSVVVAYVPGEGAVAKVLWRSSAGRETLRPWSTNPDHEQIERGPEVEIVGEVFAVLPAPREVED